jgi:acyl carrier protein
MIRDLVVAGLEKSGAAVPPDDATEHGGDSFAIWGMIEHVEEVLGVKVPDGQATPANFPTVAKAVAFFEALKK